MGVVFNELWIVLLYCFITDGISINQLPLLAKNFDFFNRLRIDLITRSAKDGLLSVNLEKC